MFSSRCRVLGFAKRAWISAPTSASPSSFQLQSKVLGNNLASLQGTIQRCSYNTSKSVFDPVNKVQTESSFAEIENRSSSKLSSEDPDYRQFVAEFPNVIQDVMALEGFECMDETHACMAKVMQYNVPHGKFLRPLLLLRTAKAAQMKTGKDLPNLHRIAWTKEFLHVFGIIMDDMMDRSKVRRKQPCWHLVDNMGPAAINDGLFLESAAYVLLKKYCKPHYPLYGEIQDMWHEVGLKTIYGQSMDVRIGNQKQFHNLTRDAYFKVTCFKSGFYTFYSPVVMGLLLNGINNPKSFKQIEKLSYEFVHLFSIQDDYIDCFVDSGKSEKIGTDIENGKASWMIITALENASLEQRRILLENYGQWDPQKVAKVKEVYEDLNLNRIYLQYEKESVNRLTTQIEQLPEDVPKEHLHEAVSLLFGRIR